LTGLGGQAQPPDLEKLAPHAAGLCLAEVLELKDFDGRAGDGNLETRVKLRIVAGTGTVLKELAIVKEYGGFRPNGPEPKPRGPLWPDSLKKGKKYWFAFCSEHEGDRYEQMVINFWPEDAPEAAAFHRAVKEDRYRWQPEYDPETRLSYGHLIEPKQQRWHVRVERAGQVLWEAALPGKKSHRAYALTLLDNGYNDFPRKMPRCGKVLFAETAQPLGKGNEYGLPAGTYYVTHAFDPENGRRLSVYVAVHQDPQVDLLQRDYDPATGRLRYEDRYDWLDQGGKAVGGKEERWWRKISRTFDPASGAVTRTEVFRYDFDRQPDRWVRVEAR
jgi:hypothetical protein